MGQAGTERRTERWARQSKKEPLGQQALPLVSIGRVSVARSLVHVSALRTRALRHECKRERLNEGNSSRAGGWMAGGRTRARAWLDGSTWSSRSSVSLASGISRNVSGTITNGITLHRCREAYNMTRVAQHGA